MYQQIHLPAEAVKQLENIYDQTDLKRLDRELERLQDRNTAAQAYQQLKSLLKDDDGNWKMLYCQLESARRVFDKYQKKQIPETVYIDTMKCFTRFLYECEKKHGQMYFDRGWWTYRQTGMCLFRIGSLEYEFVKREGVRFVAIHIPSDADLSKQAVDDSLEQAEIFFRKYFKDDRYDRYCCDSWLLSPALKPFLSQQSHILAFQSRFEILTEDAGDQEFIGWLFQVPPDTDVNDLPETTSLQRKVKTCMQNKGTIGSACGVIYKTGRPVPGLTREEEEKQLAAIIRVAQDNLTRTETYIRQLTDELDDLMDTYGTKDKEALALFHNTHSQIQENRRDLMRCQKARKKPYFGRIDFKDPKQPQTESYYVGRTGISGSDAYPLVIDWRAPIASVYYENALGPCTYQVKNEGSFAIDLKRKRTYEIENDRLKDFYDSDVVANDDLLTQYLAKSKKAVLGEIIATIQKEQNEIIRQSPKTNLIVQGVAGSGKTTVAMHRISYILYNYEERFRPQDFYIIGSNRILLNYITSVLPDLDVYGVSQMTMEELFIRLLYEEWDPGCSSVCQMDKDEEGASIKGSFAWMKDLEAFCAQYEQQTIPKTEVRIAKNGVLLLKEAEIDSYLETMKQLSMQGRINMLNEVLLSRLDTELSGKYVSYTAAEKKELRRTMRWHFGKDTFQGSIYELYEQFLQTQRQKGKDVPYTQHVFDVYDLAALAYIYKRIRETDSIREATHVIIDEAQDFGMMAYGALEYCLRGCTYTIMGDVSQNIHFGHGLNDWRELQELILTGTYDHFGLLKKSYRNTVEISHFATEILRHGNFPIYPTEPISRHGSKVRIEACDSEEAVAQTMVSAILDWQRRGRETIAVICRDEAQAKEVGQRLAQQIQIADCDLQTAEFGNGVMVLPVAYTKGLEFDAVLLYCPSAQSYPPADAYVKLLYVAATRALHELTIVHDGNLTDLIAKPVSETKRMKSLENEMRKEHIRYQKEELTAREQELIKADQGEKERTARSYLGPKPIQVKEPAQKKPAGLSDKRPDPGRMTDILSERKQRLQSQSAVPVNASVYRFLQCPDTSLLRPKGHSRIDHAIRMVRKTKKYIELIGSYGILRLTPVREDIVRVQFRKGTQGQFEAGYWNCEPEREGFWKAKDGKFLAEITTGSIFIQADKKTGALQFLNAKKKLLLSEKAAMPRQCENTDTPETWVYFDWAKNEPLFAKGLLADEWERLNQKARYISFGGRKMRMPLLVSANGYGIGVSAEKTAMCCTIPMYGNYLYTEGSEQIDYYFLYGENREQVFALYKKLQK